MGQAKQGLANNGINTDYFALHMNLASNNATVINKIVKYCTLIIHGNSNLTSIHCDVCRKLTDCRIFDKRALTFANKYSIREWSEHYITDGISLNEVGICYICCSFQ